MAGPVPPREALGASAGDADAAHRWTRLLPVAAALLVVAAAGPFAFSWAMAPRSVSVRGGAVRVERRLAPPVDLPLSRLTHVEPLDPARLDGLRRVTGTAFGDASYGTYRTQALRPFDLYAHRRGGYVLLEGPDLRVVVTPDDPAAFVRDARTGIAGR